MRKPLLIGSSVLAVCFLLILLIPSLFKTQVSEVLQNTLNESVRAEVAFSDADINLWRNFPQFTVTLEDFRLTGKNEFHADTLVRMDELHVVLSSFGLLFSDRIEVRELNLYAPKFHVVIHKNGKANYDIVASTTDTEADSSDADVSLNIESWKITDGRFSYDDQTLDLLLKGDGVELSGEGNKTGSVIALDLEASTKNFSAFYEKEAYILEKAIAFDLTSTYDLATGQFTFKDEAISVNHLQLGVDGLYRPRESGHYFDVKFHSANARFRDILSLSSDLFRDFQKMNIKGNLLLEGFVKGTWDDTRHVIPSFKVDFRVSDGSVQYNHLKSSLNEIQFDLVAENRDSLVKNTILDVKTFSVNMGRNPFRGKFKISGLKNSHIEADIAANVNLEDLEHIYPIEGIDLKGKVNLNLRADGNYHTLNGTVQQKIPTFDMSLAVRNGYFKYDHLPEAISNIHFVMSGKNQTGTLDSTVLKIEQLKAAFGDNPLDGYIHLKGFTEPIIESDLKAKIDLGEIGNFLPVNDLTLKGLFDIDMNVSGQLSSAQKKFPKIDARVNLTNAYIRSEAYPYPMENTHLVLEAVNQSGNLADTRLEIDTLTYTIEDESFFIRGQVNDLEKYNYDVAVKGILYLEKINKILNIPDLKMSGEVDVDFQTAGNLEDLRGKRYHRLPTTGQVIMKNLHFENDYLPHGLAISGGHLFFSNEKIFLDTLHGAIGASNFNLTGHLYNYLAYVLHTDEKIKGDLLLTSDNFDINELLSEKKLSPADTVHHHLRVVEVPKNIDFVFDSNIRNLFYKNLALNDLQGEIAIRDGVLTLNATSFDALGAGFHLSGDYDTRDVNHPKFDVAVDIQELDIKKAHEAFVTVQAVAPAAEDTYGVFSVNYKLKGDLLQNMYPAFESVRGSGTVRIREAKVNGMKLFHHISGITKKEELKNPELRDIVMETSVESGILYVKPFSMKLAGFDTDIEGKHNIQGTMNYIVRIALPPFGDIVKIPLHINGTYDNPRIHLGKGHEEVAPDEKIVTNE